MCDKMMVAILLGSILIIFLFHCYLKYRRVGRLLRLIPGPKEYPIIGNIYHYYVDNDRLLEKLEEMNIKFYPIHKFWILTYYGVTLLNPDDIQVLLSSNEYIEKGILYRNLQHWLSTGLLISGETAMGTKLRGNSELENKYRDAVHVYGSIVAYRMVRPWYMYDTIFRFTKIGRLQKEVLKTLHSFSRNIIAERKRFHEQTNGEYLKIFDNLDENDVFNEDLQYKKRLSMLDLLIAASWNDNQIDAEGIREEVDTFMFEGHDTTASALTFALSLFAKHKDVQENIRDEVKTIMQEDDNNITISSLKKLSYLERCLKESLRLYPSVHFISRQISHDMQLKHYLIPSGSICEVMINYVHRNPEYWPNPNVFNPDRFLPENVKGRHPYSYIPFSAGPRNCIGQKLAMLELKLFVAFILYNFELEPVDELNDVTFSADLTLNSSKSIRVKFIPIR
ncbi:PREDICTED: cytochrome P450 4C1-like isoform X3 [Polistes dominula]|uniref:Cytochrome P450 4C1-like isoform X3 n=1 Tax=Polistes dominula TaxID=743375 RepID=A0ABM1III0_POLDO|nr:PREDICTED: cytochrome P450 4C1-like isoform X3 [Polistes dominula]